MSRNLWAYPFPLSDGTIAVIQLPPDLARRDAERLKAFIDALVDDKAGSATPTGDDDG